MTWRCCIRIDETHTPHQIAKGATEKLFTTTNREVCGYYESRRLSANLKFECVFCSNFQPQQHFFVQWFCHEHTIIRALFRLFFSHWLLLCRTNVKYMDFNPQFAELNAIIWAALSKWSFFDVPVNLFSWHNFHKRYTIVGNTRRKQ